MYPYGTQILAQTWTNIAMATFSKVGILLLLAIIARSSLVSGENNVQYGL